MIHYIHIHTDTINTFANKLSFCIASLASFQHGDDCSQ